MNKAIAEAFTMLAAAAAAGADAVRDFGQTMLFRNYHRNSPMPVEHRKGKNKHHSRGSIRTTCHRVETRYGRLGYGNPFGGR